MITLIPIFLLNISSLYISKKFNLSGVIAYLIILMASLDVIYFASLTDKLLPATTLVMVALCFLFVLYVLSSNKSTRKEDFKKCFDGYMLLNNITSILFVIIFSIIKPMGYYWDEISIWQPSAKCVKLFNQLYSIGINPSSNHRTYPVGNTILNYFYSFFTRDFSEYILLLSYALLYIAVFSAVASIIYSKTRNHVISISSFFVLLLSPFMPAYHPANVDYSSLSYAYGTTMVDFNLAVVFLACVALYFYKANSKTYLLPLVFLITIKKNGIFLALLMICIVGCCELFNEKVLKLDKESLKKAFLNILAPVVVTAVAYGAWFLHLDFYQMDIQQSDFYLKDTNPVVMETVPDAPHGEKGEYVVPTVWSIVNPALRTQRYKDILQEMKGYFLTFEETIFMKDKYLIVTLLALGLIAARYAEKGKRVATAFLSVGLTAGCFVYNLVISYQMQFYNDMMVEYPRYMSSYYFSWIFAVFFLFVTTVDIKEVIRQLFICVVLLVTFGNVLSLGLDYTVFDSPDNPYYQQVSVQKKIEKAKEVLEEGDNVYLVYKDQDGWTWLKYKYEFLPVLTDVDIKSTGYDFSINFRESIDYTSDRQYYHVASPRTFVDVMNMYFDYIYVVEPDEEFYNSYKHLFSDGMTNGTLYRITYSSIPMQAVV